jgi:O-acetyl-ADP-ribose deacetylase (regulator of RNase III)
MNTIKYVTGDATRPEGEGIKFIVHVCNNIGAWGAGFVLALSKRWKEPEEAYRAMSEDEMELGNVRMVGVEDDIAVGNMIAQEGTGYAADGTPPIRYYALALALTSVNHAAILHAEYNDEPVSIHMPRIGSGLAGGDWKVIEMIIRECTTVPVTVYDLPN